jgi:hypothetical protein
MLGHLIEASVSLPQQALDFLCRGVWPHRQSNLDGAHLPSD